MPPDLKLFDPDLYDAVLFDMDGTLVDTESLWFAAERAVAARYGVVLPDEAEEVLLGLETHAIIRTLQTRYGLPGEHDAIICELREAVTDELPQNRTRAHAPQLVQRLTERYPVHAIVSNSSHEIIGATLEPHPWAKLLPKRFSADDVTRPKPLPDLYLLAAESLKVAPARCLVIEDSLSGVQAATTAGMTCIAVTFGFLAPELLEPLTPFVVEGLEQILDYF